MTKILLTWGSLRGFTQIVIVLENIYATCAVTLSAGELGAMSNNNFKGMTLVVSCLPYTSSSVDQESRDFKMSRKA